MFNIRSIIIIILGALLIAMVIIFFIKNNQYEDLSVKYDNLSSDFAQLEKNNKFLKSEIDRVHLVEETYKDLTHESTKKYEETLNEIKLMEESYKEWLDMECPVDVNGMLTKGCNKVQSSDIRATEPSTR